MGASTEVVIGIPIHHNDILTTFTRTWEAIPAAVLVEEKSHLEDRFDPKTGAKLAPIKVIDGICQMQPAVMMVGEFLSEQEYQTFMAGPGVCHRCLDGTAGKCKSAIHHQAYGQHEVQSYSFGEEPPHIDTNCLAEGLVRRFNARRTHGDEFIVLADGYRGAYHHFSVASLMSQQDDGSISALDVVDAMAKLGQLRTLLLESGLSNVPVATITPVFHE